MTRPRNQLVCIDDTPYYHITSRCVRRSFLCGFDKETGKNYEHRRQWIVDRIRLLSSLFAIDICAFAALSNHYHLVLKLDPDQVNNLTDKEVVQRWRSLFKGPILIQQYQAGETLTPPELDTVSTIIALWRERLSSLSWFMYCLNYPIAVQANREDNCTGHFWQARYSSQALRTEEALISCLAYVDLNPIRAGMADTPESSDYTSIQERIKPQFNLARAIKEQTDQEVLFDFPVELKALMPFLGSTNLSDQAGIPLAFSAYLELVDWTGRAVVQNKRGSIPSNLPPILQRLGIDESRWASNATQFEAVHRQRFSRQRLQTIPDTG